VRAGTFTVNGVELTVDSSVGVVLAPKHGTDVDVLLQRADVAMHQAKQANLGVAVYDEANDPHDVAQLGLLAELRRAIEQDELVLHYQPKLAMATGKLVGVEALVRWQHPTRGLLAPGAFVPIAENTALMSSMTDWVLRSAIAQAADWRRAGWTVPVAVNVSPRSLLDGDLAGTVLHLLAESGLPAELLELEITETAIMTDPARASAVLTYLGTLGVHVSIDDFGVGYTSLGFLKSLPVHALKIDRSFITDLLTDERDQAITETVIALAHRLGLTVVAEGIETEDVWQRLHQLGCDSGQGYHLARPMPTAALTDWLVDRLSPVTAARR
jgi:EAL domain-containing protein (putative c-di-GMP-specific phosphodiesterase class I)